MNDDHPNYKKYTMITSPPEGDELALMENNMEENEEMNAGKKFSPILVVGSLLVVILIVVGLFLPPISLGQRLGMGGNNEEPGRETEIELEAVSGVSVTAVNTSVTVLDEAEGATAVAAIPSSGVRTGNLYAIHYEGDAPNGTVALIIPADAGSLKTLDLYGWDGSAWHFIPSQIDATTQQLVAAEVPMPQVVTIMQMEAVGSPAVGAELLPGQELPVEVLPQLTEVSAGTLTLVGTGELEGEVTAVPTGAYDQYLRVTNTSAIVDQQALVALLNDTAAQDSHINALVQQVGSGNFAGLNLDYQGVQADQGVAFSSFVAKLADALHAQGDKLAVTLATPQRTDTSWDTAGQDWMTVSQAADLVYLQMPLNPTVYSANGIADQLINFAVRQIDRQKLTVMTSVSAIDNIGESFLEMPNSAALENFGDLQFVQGGEEVEPGAPIEVALSGTASPLEWDGASLTYKYSYEQAGQKHNVWLGNEAALNQRMAVVQPYNVRGVALRGLGDVTDGAGYAAAINSFLGQGDAPSPAGAAIVWTVTDDSGSVLASSSGEALSFTWDGVEQAGEYTIDVEFALGENVAELGSLAVAVAEPEPVVEETPEEETVEETAVSPTTVTATGDTNATVVTPSNVRLGPGLGYGTISGGINAGTRIEIIGRTADSDWFNIIMPDGETEGWIYSTLVEVDSGLNIAGLPESEIPPLVASNNDGGGNSSGGGGTAAPPPVSAPPVSNAGFELGGQTHGFANPTLMASAGMNWVKFQHKWGPGDSPDAVAGRIQQAHANGFKVLLSIPGSATYPTSIDFNGYVSFLGGVAALGPDAIEVWNEMNIDFEWPAGQIDPASYVNNMLAPAYNAIKSANSSVMVISGAPAPTGFDNGTNAWSDSRYLSGLAAAGAASYMDCMGAHFNAGATSPYQTTGHPAGNDHYSWHFQPTLNLYATLGKPVCFTELGYLSGEDFGGVPPRFSWAANTTVSQHAQWLGEAVSLAGSSGKVRMVIIFNVDFTFYGDDPQAGYAIIRPGGGCPACQTLASVMGR